MSCHGCTGKFGFLSKEYGCPKCGFAYCKKCLRFQVTDPKTSKQISVCSKCHHSVQSPLKEPIAVIHALHRLESLDDPAKPPITVYRQPAVKSVRLQELRRGLSFEDQKILERLESLKQDDSQEKENSGKRRKSEKAEEEIAERLARLKGEEYDPEAQNKPVTFRNVKPETEEDVIAKFTAEVEMDSKYDSSVVSDLEARLARLRGDREKPEIESGLGRSAAFSPDMDMDELTEEEQINLMIKKIKDDLAIEQRVGIDVGHDMDVDVAESSGGELDKPVGDESDDDIDVDELCGICSEKRATLKCDECDGDIFCRGCFQELHLDLGEVHKAKVLKKGKK